MNIEYDTVDKTRCLCCERRLIEKEMHHFPVPKRHGGEMVVPMCRDCHNMADRKTLHRLDKQIENFSMDAAMGCTEKAKHFMISTVMLMRSIEDQTMMDTIIPNWFEDNIEKFQYNDEEMSFKLLEGCTLEGKLLVMRVISRYYDIVEDFC